jgi:hypothetical protein
VPPTLYVFTQLTLALVTALPATVPEALLTVQYWPVG